MDLEQLSKNIKIVKQNVADICEQCGRENDVLIVGASKTMPQQIIDMVDENHLLDVLGENKAQEIVEKYKQRQSFEWHFIGTLQSNKVKYIIDKVSLIHSVDKFSLAQEIDKQAKKNNLTMQILLQINMGKEESKSGFYIEKVEDAILQISQLNNVKIVGLMAVMPICEQEKTIKLFCDLKQVYQKLKQKYNLKYLSAGMTNDYELAIKYAGANIVRIGRAIFGERCYNGKI